ncbi:MAG: TPR end-of-group domain-containing protein [Syntrophales bacterium]
MSYINDALRKAQRERDGRYERFGGIIAAGSAAPRQPGKRRFAAVAAFALAILIPAGLLFAVYVLQQPSPPKSGGAPPAAVATPAPLPSIVLPATREATTERAASAASAPANPAGGKAALSGRGTPVSVSPAAKTVPPAPAAGGRAAVREAEARYAEALAAQRRGDVPAADALYQKVLALDPSHVRALNNLGVIRMEQQRREQAIALFSKAIAVKKEYVDPYYNLACLYARTNEIDESLWYLKVAIAINGDVKHWAEKDADLKQVVASPAFRKIREGQKN